MNITLTADEIKAIEEALPADQVGGKGMRNFVFTNGKMCLG